MFEDRRAAGVQLAKDLRGYKDNAIVLALPRGGVEVGAEVAKALSVPFDVIIARKLGAPHNPELGIGAVSEGDSEVLSHPIISSLGITKKEIQLVRRKEAAEMERRINLYRDGRGLPELSGKTVILVDDGLATGVTAQAAILAIKKLRPRKIIFAAPVCALDSAKKIKSEVDSLICTVIPHDLTAISLYYKNFPQVEDQEVIKILDEHKVGIFTIKNGR
ncbi:MAG: phosphoribosyltransferase family protein [Candidatus Levyibacteriota bacterium]